MLENRSVYWEEQAWLARERLEKDHEHHTVAKLPCCGSGVEITDPTIDNYVVCPNPQCRKQAVVVGDRRHQVIMEKPNVQPDRNLIW